MLCAGTAMLCAGTRNAVAISTTSHLLCASVTAQACRNLEGYGLKGSIPSPTGWDLPDALTELWFRTTTLTGKSSLSLHTWAIL